MRGAAILEFGEVGVGEVTPTSGHVLADISDCEPGNPDFPVQMERSMNSIVDIPRR